MTFTSSDNAMHMQTSFTPSIARTSETCLTALTLSTSELVRAWRPFWS